MKRISVLVLLLAGLLVSGFAQASGPASTAHAPKKPILLVMDIQKAFMAYMDAEDARTAPAVINQAIDLFRALKLPIIRIYHTYPGQGPKEGTPAFEFIPEIKVTQEDIRVIKNYPNAFTKTDLAGILKKKDCDAVFICGLSATGCALATCFGAMDQDLQSFMIKGAVLSPNHAHTQTVEAFTEALTLDQIKALVTPKP